MEIEVVAGDGGGKAVDRSGGSFSRSNGSGSGSGSSYGGGDVEMGWPRTGGEANLVWQDLTVMLPNFGHGPTRKLLNGLNGYAEPGRIMAIMGPSGSGKSTLLDSLAGRLSRNVVMMGNILLNGKKRRLDYGGVVSSSDQLHIVLDQLLWLVDLNTEVCKVLIKIIV